MLSQKSMKVLCLLLLCAVLAPSLQAAASTAQGTVKPILGDLDLRAPDGEKISLISFIGRKTVVVVFWATWCPVCKEEVPHLKKLHANPDLKVIAVNEGENIRKVNSFIAENSIGYQVVLDPKASLAKAFGVPGMPYCVILDKSGVITYRNSGLPANLDTYLQK
jgi:thiol-disulfide isomerase/thioredoxin